MQRLTAMFSILMLVLSVWAGSSAHAAERLDCIPVSAEAPGHFEGDRDEEPSQNGEGVAHHHSSCNGHQSAAAGDGAIPMLFASRHAFGGPLAERYELGQGPNTQLRPPIA